MVESRPQPVIRLRTKLLAAAAALMIGLSLAEIAARAFYPRPPELGREPQLRYRSDPEVGFIHVSNQSGYLDDGLATINDLGLRGARPEVPKPANAVRVLAIGDSTTFGWGVDDPETYTVQLEVRLRAAYPGQQVEVVNAGVVSYDLDQTARLLKRVAPVLEPDIVLVGVLWNDLPYEEVSPEGVPQPRRASAPRVAAARASNGAAETFRMANQPTGIMWLARKSRLLFAVRHAWLAALAPTEAATNQVQWEMALLGGRETDAIENAWRVLGKTFGEIESLGETYGFRVGVLTMPIRAQVEQSYPNAAYQRRVRALAEDRGFFVIDPLESFAAASSRNQLFIPYDRMHFTGAGNALLAAAAFEVLRARPEFRHLVSDGDVK
jgi:lysophospholipase L1-like esterase